MGVGDHMVTLLGVGALGPTAGILTPTLEWSGAPTLLRTPSPRGPCICSRHAFVGWLPVARDSTEDDGGLDPFLQGRGL